MSGFRLLKREVPLDRIKMRADIRKLNIEAEKLHAETLKIQRENKWMPIVYTIGFFGAAAAFAKLFVH
jgi:uncharacterized membrane protein YjjP (DUF1212 family)